MTIKVTMTIDRETKGSVLYKTDTWTQPIQNIYVKKASLPTPYPKVITVTVETHNDPS